MVVVYEGFYTRNGPETLNVYNIEKKTSPMNYSSLSSVLDFTLVKSIYKIIPSNWIYYFKRKE